TVEFNSRTNPTERLEFITLKLVDQPEDALRIWAVQNVYNWCESPPPPSREITDALIRLLKPYITDPNPLVRQHTADALGLIDENGDSTADDLLNQLKIESDPRVQAEILITLADFLHTPVADQALVLLQSSDNNVVAQAARTLGKICPVDNPPLPQDIINRIAQTLPLVYQHHPEAAAIKQNIIYAMKSIATMTPYRPVALEQFNTILIQALKENAPSIRVEAVDALTELHQNAVLPLILDLLNDPDSAVRQDVIRTIGKYPQTEMLNPLHQRLAQEIDPDVAGAIRSVFETILNRTPMQSCYDWALKLQNTVPSEETALYEGIIEILRQKINRARTANQEFPDEYEILVLLHRIDRSRRNARYNRAANDYFALLKFDSINPAQKNNYQVEIISLVLDNNLLNLYNRTRVEALEPLLAEPNAVQALQPIESAYQQQLQNGQLLRAAGIIAYLILPIQNQLLQPEIKAKWDTHRRNIALGLITAEQQRLNSNNPQHTPEAIDLLLLLDSRLEDFPTTDTSIQKKLAWLQNAETLIRGSTETFS
ncbi:MAG: HEAT repeat domain-containing protein, partial [Planctomycetes bacterium]|nr:HEAT repeat domain-containing protein [Planctomycetota bacterium]